MYGGALSSKPHNVIVDHSCCFRAIHQPPREQPLATLIGSRYGASRYARKPDNSGVPKRGGGAKFGANYSTLQDERKPA